MNGLAVTTTETGFVLNIPWRIWVEKLLGWVGPWRKKELTEEEALRVFEEGEQEYR